MTYSNNIKIFLKSDYSVKTVVRLLYAPTVNTGNHRFTERISSPKWISQRRSVLFSKASQ